MDPGTATVLAVGSSLLSGGLAIAQGFASQSSLSSQAKALEMDAQAATLQAKQVSGLRAEEINDVIAAQNLIRSGRNLSLDSATGRALRKEQRLRGIEQKNAETLSILQRRDGYVTGADNARAAADMAPILGFVSATGDFAQAGKDAQSLGGFG